MHLEQAGVRRADAAEHSTVAETLAAAFADDPAWAFILPDEGDREQRLRLFFETDLRHLVPARREVWVTEDAGVAAVWGPPGRWAVPVRTVLAETPQMARVFGRRLALAMRYLIRVERLHPRRPGHWYLHYLGARPECQGRGLGSAVLAPLLARCDRELAPAYLESSSERNRVLYERHGFEVVERFDIPGGGPAIRRMWREPGLATP